MKGQQTTRHCTALHCSKSGGSPHYYSANVGPVHILALSPYVDFVKGEALQRAWPRAPAEQPQPPAAAACADLDHRNRGLSTLARAAMLACPQMLVLHACACALCQPGHHAMASMHSLCGATPRHPRACCMRAWRPYSMHAWCGLCRQRAVRLACARPEQH